MAYVIFVTFFFTLALLLGLAILCLRVEKLEEDMRRLRAKGFLE